jgi:hypothetical protein
MAPALLNFFIKILIPISITHNHCWL